MKSKNTSTVFSKTEIRHTHFVQFENCLRLYKTSKFSILRGCDS